MNVSSNSNPVTEKNRGFHFAPANWQKSEAERIARDEGIEPGRDHWLLLQCLQEYFSRHENSDINVRELKDALDESFHQKGGINYLHRLFPGGPVTQGCRLAGLPVPSGAVDKSFSCVQKTPSLKNV